MIKRKILKKLSDHLTAEQMTILVGPRQVGKTYLMRVLQKQIEATGRQTVWFNLDNEEDKRRFGSQAELLAQIELRVGKAKAVVFIDEIQRKEDAGLFLKGIYDMNTPYKFVVSGSGSLELKAKIPESMAGRKRLFTINPVNFEEFVNHKTDYQYEEKLDDFFRLEGELTARLMAEYMVFGGYPRVILAETAALKQTEMQEIYHSYVDRDLTALLRLEKTEALGNLLKILAAQIGSLVNITKLAAAVNIDQKTLKQYLFYLEQTFIIQKITPYFRNVRSEIAKAPIYYFVDIGLRNWLLGLFGLNEMPASLSGHLYEQVVINTLKNQLELTPTQVHFWRTKDQAEVDIVLVTGLEAIPVEVKYSQLANLEIPRSLRSFLTKYRPARGFVVHMGNLEKQQRVESTMVTLKPFSRLLTLGMQING